MRVDVAVLGLLLTFGLGPQAFATGKSCVYLSQSGTSTRVLTIAHGQTVVGYLSAAALPGKACAAKTMKCQNGNLPGGTQYRFSSCSGSPAVPSAPAKATAAKSCSFAGRVIPSGKGIATYAEAVVPWGELCQMKIAVCREGRLQGGFNHASCSAAPALSCRFGGRDVANGRAVTGFLARADGRCSSLALICLNGKLSGQNAFPFPSCALALANRGR